VIVGDADHNDVVSGNPGLRKWWDTKERGNMGGSSNSRLLTSDTKTTVIPRWVLEKKELFAEPVKNIEGKLGRNRPSGKRKKKGGHDGKRPPT